METKIYQNIEFYPIANFPKYFISKCGKIFSEKTNKILKPSNVNGYLQLQLCKDGKEYHKKNHRLVAETFIPNPENKQFIDHKNRIKTDNRLENLRWVTVKENSQNQSKKDTTLWQGVDFRERKARSNSFRASWRDENNKKCEASYSYGVYGIFALLLAIDKREEMVDKLYNRPE